MREKMCLTVLVVAGLAAVGCGGLFATPTPAATLTTAPLPTAASTKTPTTEPPAATPTEAPSPVPEEHITDWNGIPIMEGASGGLGDDTTYSYAVTVTPEDVKAYYVSTLQAQGWALVSSVDGKSTSVFLTFTKDQQTVEIGIAPLVGGTAVFISF